MTLDFGLFSAVRQRLLAASALRDFKVYVLCPPQRHYPLIVLDLEEIWTSFLDQPILGKRRIIFSIIISVPALQQAVQQTHMALIIKLLDGFSLPLDGGREGVTRFLKGIQEVVDKQGILTLKSTFETYIH